MRYFIYDERFGYTYFDTESARDAAFWSAQHIDSKHWWVGSDKEAGLKAAPRFLPDE